VGYGKSSFVRRSNKSINLTGRQFTRLHVIRDTERRTNKRILWLCRCKCGNLKEVRSSHLLGGRIVSCGCYQRERSAARSRTHGLSRYRVYAVYRAILQRCNDPNATNYERYGGRGVKVCKRWSGRGGFERFISDMGMPPNDDLTIERRSNRGNYTPRNCCWATKSVQARNKHNNRKVTWRGRLMLLIEVAELERIPYKVLHQRHIQRGWGLERAVNQPLRKCTKG
jgi:hypothetical protein